MIELQKIQPSEELEPVVSAFVINGIADNPFLTIEDITKFVRDGSCELYRIVSESGVIGATAIEYLENSRSEKHLNIIGISCSFGAYDNRIDILSGIETIARRAGCRKIFASGRVGWIKLAKELGYSTTQHVLFWRTLDK